MPTKQNTKSEKPVKDETPVCPFCKGSLDDKGMPHKDGYHLYCVDFDPNL